MIISWVDNIFVDIIALKEETVLWDSTLSSKNGTAFDITIDHTEVSAKQCHIIIFKYAEFINRIQTVKRVHGQ